MGFIMKLEAVEDCLSFIERQSPFRFCFLAVGSPQQEMLAALLRQRGIARGLALCIGASLNFLTGRERRAPLWMQRLSLEWLYRLARDPRRLWVRYLVRGPRIFGHLRQAQVVLRPRATSLQ
jgi:exopolysaccharide biosynthesis WecB/TagA/CpsF family protein